MKKYIAPEIVIVNIYGEMPLLGTLPDSYHGSVGMPARRDGLAPVF